MRIIHRIYGRYSEQYSRISNDECGDRSVLIQADRNRSGICGKSEYINVNALLSLSLAVNESGWGTSWICTEKNNIFGLNAVDTSPGLSADSFASIEDCIREFYG